MNFPKYANRLLLNSISFLMLVLYFAPALRAQDGQTQSKTKPSSAKQEKKKQSAAVVADTKIEHSFIGVGRASGIVVVGEDGKVKWKHKLPASDAWVLENGNVLAALYPSKGFPKGCLLYTSPSPRDRG